MVDPTSDRERLLMEKSCDDQNSTTSDVVDLHDSQGNDPHRGTTLFVSHDRRANLFQAVEVRSQRHSVIYGQVFFCHALKPAVRYFSYFVECCAAIVVLRSLALNFL